MTNIISNRITEENWVRKFNPEKRLLTGRSYLLVKRIIDLILVTFSIPIWFPLIGVIYLMIIITSPGAPAFFIQNRTGKGGKRFKMYKFRSMVPNAEALKGNFAKLNSSGDLAGPLKLQDDPRITKVGKFLRKTSLDEIPQIFNVIKNEMSLVGPRPTSWSAESYKLWQTERLDVLPGITGLWQVCGRGSEDFDDWLRWDIRYIEKRSLWLDVMILIKTFTNVLRQRGAR